MTILSKSLKVILTTIKILQCEFHNFLLLNWFLFMGVEMNLGHAHETRFWYLLGVFLKFSDEHPLDFCRGVPSCPQGNSDQTFMGIAWCKEVHFFGLCMLWESEKKNALANIYKFMK